MRKRKGGWREKRRFEKGMAGFARVDGWASCELSGAGRLAALLLSKRETGGIGKEREGTEVW